MIKLRIHTILRTCLALLATAGLPCVNALQCYTDINGFRRCRLSTGARIGIAIAIFVAFFLFLLGSAYYVRRRRARQNMAYVTAQPNINSYGYQAGYYPNQPYPNQSYPYGNPPYDPTNTQQQYQYPPPGGDYYNQNAYQGGYAPPPGPPNASKYEPPRSPPPVQTKV